MSEIVTVFDLETTGLDYVTDHITEIAAIRAVIEDDGTIRELGRFQTLVALPDGEEVPPFITELTGIKTESLVGAPAELDAIIALEAFFWGTTVIAHNAPFDLAFINYETAPESFVCTRALAKLTEMSESASLKHVCARHGIELTGHHRAINDAAATLQVYAKLRPVADVLGLKYRNVVIDSEDRPLTFVPDYAEVVRV